MVNFEKLGTYFPVKLVWLENVGKLTGPKIRGPVLQHLYFAERLKSDDLGGNLVVMWRGPVNVRARFNPDTTERINKGKKSYAVRGPDLIRIVADFPQIGGDLMLICSLQNILVEMLAEFLLKKDNNKRITVSESDIYVENKKLNIGTGLNCFSSSQSITSINLTFKGLPRVPNGVKAACLKELLAESENEIIEDVKAIVKKWLARIDLIQERVNRAKDHYGQCNFH